MKRILKWAAIGLAAVFLLGVLALRAAFPGEYRAYSIPTASMEPTVLVGDHVFVEMLNNPKIDRGEIVMLRFEGGKGLHLERIVGVPGDHIRITNKQLFVNGKPPVEPYAVHRTDYVSDYRDNFPGTPDLNVEAPAYDMLEHHVAQGELVLPDGKYFAMGDNRDNSSDSRFQGLVAQRDILGKPVMVYYSIEPGMYDDPRWSVRWDRTFHRIQ